MEVYVVSKYGYCMGIEHKIIGIFKDIEQAKKCYLDTINEYKERNYEEDDESKGKKGNNSTNFIRLFADWQENWDSYIDIEIEKMKIN